MKLPQKKELPCSCYVFDEEHPENYHGCSCGNYDDARSQGCAQGWNDCLEAISKPQHQVENTGDARRYRIRREQAYFAGRQNADNLDYAAFCAAYDAVSDASLS
jgi:hypothetical protein